MLLSARVAGAVMVTSTVAVPPAGTVTDGTLKATPAGAMKKAGTKVFGPVARAATWARAEVTGAGPLFSMVRVRVAGPAWLSPRASLPGSTLVVDSTASAIWTRPAP